MTSQSIENVLSTLEELRQNSSFKDDKKNFEVLLKSIPNAVDEIYLFRSKPELQLYSNKIKLCYSQMAKALPSLVKLLSARTDPALKEISHYLVDKLHWCFSEILRIIQGGGLLDDSEPSGLFIKSVNNLTNFCLSGEKTDTSMKGLVEDLLCHGLTIAKVAEFEDYNEIAAACRNVLTNTSGVSSVADIEEKEPLKKDAILCSIAILERKVNTAVLRLYLNVSSRFLPPLKNIVKKSSNNLNDSSKSRRSTDIQHEVNILDQYFERVQLIGNYAVACTECKNKKLKVLCSLASLEFLANYIIPAATSFYIDPNNLLKKRFLQFLTDEALDELKALTGLLDYNIVDTETFVQVFHEDVVDVIFDVKKKIYSGSYSPLDSNELVSKCYKLVNHLKSTNDISVKGNQNVTNIAKQLLNAVKDHGEQSRDSKALLNKKLFCTKLDYIIIKIGELLQHLNDESLNTSKTTCPNNSNICHEFMQMDKGKKITFTNCPQKSSAGNIIQLKNQYQIDVVSSTPLSTSGSTKISATRYTTYKLVGTPTTTSDNDFQSLDPYLSKIRETPLLRSAIRVKTPYREVYLKRALPKHLSFISDAENSAVFNHSPSGADSYESYKDK